MVEERESIEWSNTWIAKANLDYERCLLIGDSVTRQIRSELEVLLSEWLAVDLFAASFSLTDNIFWTSIHNFLASGYRYKMIIIHYGFHHGFSLRCSQKKEDYETYKEKYQDLINICKQVTDCVILMTGNSYVLADDLEQVNVQMEPEIVERNRISKELVIENQCRLFDLYELMKTEHSQFRYSDHVHFVKSTYSYICNCLVKYIRMNTDVLQVEMIGEGL